MKIFITTLGRIDNQITLNNILGTGRSITLVVQDYEYRDHKKKYENEQVKVIGLPKEIKTLGPTRKHLCETYTNEKIILLDDDLGFFYRDINLKPIKTTDPNKLNNLFDTVDGYLVKYAHVGVASGKELGLASGSIKFNGNFKENHKYMRFLAYNTSLFPKGIKCGRVDIMSDYDLNLQLLINGCPNIVLFTYGQQDPPPDKQKGGCTEQRNAEKHKIERDKMISWYPAGIVKHGLATSPYSAVCQWKKAYEWYCKHSKKYELGAYREWMNKNNRNEI